MRMHEYKCTCTHVRMQVQTQRRAGKQSHARTRTHTRMRTHAWRGMGRTPAALQYSSNCWAMASQPGTADEQSWRRTRSDTRSAGHTFTVGPTYAHRNANSKQTFSHCWPQFESLHNVDLHMVQQNREFEGLRGGRTTWL